MRIPRSLPVLGAAVALALLSACNDGGAAQPAPDDAAQQGEADTSVPADAPEPSPGASQPEVADPVPSAEPAPEEVAEPEPALGAYGVTAGHPLAVEAGMDVLSAGGNAVDAAVATAYALGVVEPFGSGIGGGGVALVHHPGEEPAAFDYQETAAQDGQVPSSSIGIPGFVAGMQALHDAHGTGEIADLIEPSVHLAADGVEVSAMIADRLEAAAHRLVASDIATFFPGGGRIPPGETLVQEELADTLRTIAAQGPESFYEGPLGEELSERVEGIDPESLAAYEVGRPRPPVGSFGGFQVVGAPAPYPGAALVQSLQVAEALGVADYEAGSADFVHAVGMAWLLSNHFRIAEIGDPAFVDVPLDDLTDPERSASLAEQISMDEVLEADDSEPYGGLRTDTTHVTVVDAEGTMVSMTNTLANFWGSGRYELGFFLNDQLRNFASSDWSPNQPEPGKRPRSYITPMIIADADNRPVLGLGSPGGRRIPVVLSQVITRWALHDQDLADAVAAPRFHREGEQLIFEQRPSSQMASDLRGRGYTDIGETWLRYYFGGVQALEVDHERGTITGAADDRRDGTWEVDTP